MPVNYFHFHFGPGFSRTTGDDARREPNVAGNHGNGKNYERHPSENHEWRGFKLIAVLAYRQDGDDECACGQNGEYHGRGYDKDGVIEATTRRFKVHNTTKVAASH